MSFDESSRRPNGALLMIGATGIAGIAGYVVTWLVYRSAGPASYAAFAVFWSALFLMVGSLSGVQQEIARATRVVQRGAGAKASRARSFGLVASATVLLVTVATAPLWHSVVFPVSGWGLVWPLAVGAASYVLVAVLCGSLYGVMQWRSLALLLVIDSLLRLIFVGIGLAAGGDIVAIAWAVAVPFGLTLVVLWPVIRGGLVNRTQLDVGYRSLSWNVVRTVGASVSTAVLVSGFPLLLGVLGGGVDDVLLGELIFAITLARAPLIVTVMSLQSLLLVRFRDNVRNAPRLLVIIVGAIAATAAILAAVGWLIGSPVLAWVSGHPTQIDGALLAVLLLSSGAIAALSVSGAAVLAAGSHLVYLAGWAIAAVATIGILLAPGDFVQRVGVAVIVAPLLGLALHAAWLLSRASWRLR